MELYSSPTVKQAKSKETKHQHSLNYIIDNLDVSKWIYFQANQHRTISINPPFGLKSCEHKEQVLSPIGVSSWHGE